MSDQTEEPAGEKNPTAPRGDDQTPQGCRLGPSPSGLLAHDDVRSQHLRWTKDHRKHYHSGRKAFHHLLESVRHCTGLADDFTKNLATLDPASASEYKKIGDNFEKLTQEDTAHHHLTMSYMFGASAMMHLDYRKLTGDQCLVMLLAGDHPADTKKVQGIGEALAVGFFGSFLHRRSLLRCYPRRLSAHSYENCKKFVGEVCWSSITMIPITSPGLGIIVK